MAHAVSPATAPSSPGTKRRAPIRWGPYLLLLPSIVLLSVFTIFPMFKSGYLSLFMANLAHREPVYTGIGNYKELFMDDTFRLVMKNTFIYAVGTIPLSVILALFLATQLNRKLPGVAFLRAAYFYPTMLPLVSAASLWNFMYNPHYGPVNQLVQFFGGHGQNWLGDPTFALYAVMFVSIWKDAGYFMIFYLAGLQNLPADVYEAAELDGASRWQQFWRITFPLLTPTTLFVATISFINAFKTVDHIFIMTGGGPANATKVLMYYMWETVFANNDRGMGAAVTVVLVAILLVIALFNHFVVDRKVHYE